MAALNLWLSPRRSRGGGDEPPSGYSTDRPRRGLLKRKVIWDWDDIFALNRNIFCERSDGGVGTTTDNTEPTMESNQTVEKAERLLWHFDSGP